MFCPFNRQATSSSLSCGTLTVASNRALTGLWSEILRLGWDLYVSWRIPPPRYRIRSHQAGARPFSLEGAHTQKDKKIQVWKQLIILFYKWGFSLLPPTQFKPHPLHISSTHSPWVPVVSVRVILVGWFEVNGSLSEPGEHTVVLHLH